MRRFKLFFALIFTLLLAGSLKSECIPAGGVGRDCLTFEQRKTLVLNNTPSPESFDNYADPFKAARDYYPIWLEKGMYNTTISDITEHIIKTWWTQGKGQQSHYAFMVFAAIKYENLIPQTDRSMILNKYSDWIQTSKMFGGVNDQKQVNAMVGTYIYAEFFNNSIEFPTYGDGMPEKESAWPDFSYNGRTYTFGGGPYNAKLLSGDWLERQFDAWYVRNIGSRGNMEWDSPNYSRGFEFGPSVLYSALGNNHPFKTKAKMATDLMLLDWILDFGNSNGLGGTFGRSQYKYTRDINKFPVYEYWGMSRSAGRFSCKAAWCLDYKPNNVMVDLAVLTDEDDNYFQIHKEFNDNSMFQGNVKGKWNFITKNYSLGSADGGWQAVINAGDNKFIRCFINDTAIEPDDNHQGTHIGKRGRQFKNSMFINTSNEPHYWQMGDGSWDQQETIGNWHFRKEGKSMVAFSLGTSKAAFEIVTEGVEFPSFTSFKDAIITNASLGSNFYINSRGDRIDSDDFCGFDNPGDCQFPFKRMTTVDNSGNSLLAWNNDVMIASKNGQSYTYDFNDWTLESGGTPPPDTTNGGDLDPPPADTTSNEVLVTADMIKNPRSTVVKNAGIVTIYSAGEGKEKGFTLLNPFRFDSTQKAISFDIKYSTKNAGCENRTRLLYVGEDIVQIDTSFKNIYMNLPGDSLDFKFDDGCLIWDNGIIDQVQVRFFNFKILYSDSSTTPPPDTVRTMEVEEISHWIAIFHPIDANVDMTGSDTLYTGEIYRSEFEQPLTKTKFDNQPDPITYEVDINREIKQAPLFMYQIQDSTIVESTLFVTTPFGQLLDVGNWALGLICVTTDGKMSKESNWNKIVVVLNPYSNWAPSVPR
jgi:hypothetical protein